jgi:holliday junction DNA helicase RuvA
MIAYLKGQPILKQDKLIIVCNGVGYGVNTGAKVLTKSNQEILELFIYTHVKEDKLELYGFLTQQEQNLFELVLSVSGVGPKTALPIVDAGAEKLVTSVQNANLGFFTAVPRVGKKLAQKIIIELKSKLGSIKDLNLTPMTKKQQDVVDALSSLGFDENQASDLVLDLDLEKLDIKQAIKICIKKLSNEK